MTDTIPDVSPHRHEALMPRSKLNTIAVALVSSWTLDPPVTEIERSNCVRMAAESCDGLTREEERTVLVTAALIYQRSLLESIATAKTVKDLQDRVDFDRITAWLDDPES
ncbi:hypothetical protein BH09ACT1_BH09ACT1_20750 [soil metagenome]